MDLEAQVRRHRPQRFNFHPYRVAEHAVNAYRAYHHTKDKIKVLKTLKGATKKNPYPTPPSDRKRKSNNQSFQQAKKLKFTKQEQMPKAYRKQYKKPYSKSAKRYKKTKRVIRKNWGSKKSRSVAVNPPEFYAFGMKFKQPKLFKQLQMTKQKISYQEEDEAICSIIGGRQCTQLFEVACRKATLLDIFAKGSQYFLTGTGSNTDYVNVTDAANTRGWTYLLHNWTSTLRMTNQAPSSAEITAYFLLSKKDDTNIFDPIADWQNGYGEQDGTSGTSSTTYVGAKPWESKRFNLRHKIIKTIKIKLPPGGERTMKFRHDCNRLVNGIHVNNYATYGGLQGRWLIVNHGIPADTGNNFDGGNITTTPSKLDVHQVLKYEGTMLNTFPKITYKALTTLEQNDPSNGVHPSLYTIADAAGTIVDNHDNTKYA